MRSICVFRQSVPHAGKRECALTRVSAGHTLKMRGCNTTNPATNDVSGIHVGHFGGGIRKCA